jgi:UDP-N-acetylmuramate--alanine ligase
VIRYGIESPDARLRAVNLRREGLGTRFDVVFDDEMVGEVKLAIPGEHNVRNALGALAVGLLLGATVPAMAPGIGSFRGVERRFQLLGEVGDVMIVDDYAHHPTEVRASVQAARAAAPDRRLVVAFQPHLFTRTRDFAREFAEALALADVVLLLDIYPAREKPVVGVTSQLIADQLSALGSPIAWTGARTALSDALVEVVRPTDLVVLMGAGDITRSGPELLSALGAAAA